MSGVFATNPRDAPGPGEALFDLFVFNGVKLRSACRYRPFDKSMVILCCAVVWRERVVVGETDMNPQEVQEVVQQLGNEYRGNAYHLLERNCNHFTDDLAFKLTGNHAPPWVRSKRQHASYRKPSLPVSQRCCCCLSSSGCLQAGLKPIGLSGSTLCQIPQSFMEWHPVTASGSLLGMIFCRRSTD